MKREPKQETHVPTERDTKMRAAMSALLACGSSRKAAAACGVSDRTIAHWAQTDEGRAILDDLRTSEAPARVTRIWALVDKLLDRLEKALDADEIPATALAVNIGILADKARAMAPKAEEDTGEIVVQVFGGTLNGGQGAPSQGVAAQVTIKGGRNAQE